MYPNATILALYLSSEPSATRAKGRVRGGGEIDGAAAIYRPAFGCEARGASRVVRVPECEVQPATGGDW